MNSIFYEQLTTLGQQIRRRRLATGLTQQAAAAKAGVAYRTWRRMEGEGNASIEDLVRAAIALRCEQGVAALFPEPAASTMDELLMRQRMAAVPQRKRAGRTQP
jgi:transcriptional regulator with XRE-family HTH domain